jgi:hypothetical protein
LSALPAESADLQSELKPEGNDEYKFNFIISVLKED